MLKRIEISEKNKKILLNLGLLVATIIVFLIIGEIATRIIIGTKMSFTFEDNGLFYPKPNQTGWQHTDSVFNKARINNIGSRGEDVNPTAVKNNNKYVFLGDSFTFGWLLKDNETVAEYFKRSGNLSDEQVINYASPSHGIDHMKETYKFHQNLFKQGDVFFLVLIDNDFARPLNPVNKEGLKYRLSKLKRHSAFATYTYERMGPILYRIKDGLGVQPKFEDEYFNETNFHKITEFKTELERNEQELVVVFYEYNETSFSQKAEILCTRNNVSCVWNVPEFISQLDEDEPATLFDGHPSGYSNEKVAEGLANFIKLNNISI